MLAIQDPTMVQDIYTRKNKLIDKNGMSQTMFDDLVGKSFVFSKGDKQWETIRKASAHAFYKERLQKMMLVLKEKVE